MSENPFSFSDHKVTPEGLYIRGIGPGQTIFGAKVEILVPRSEAESFGWIDPLTEDELEQIRKQRIYSLMTQYWTLSAQDKREIREFILKDEDEDEDDED